MIDADDLQAWVEAETQQDRFQAMRAAIHSVEMEGGEVDQETQAQMTAYARGEITAQRLRQWVLEHGRRIADDQG